MKIYFLSSWKDPARCISTWVTESDQSLCLTLEGLFNLNLIKGFVLQSNFDYVQEDISFCITGKKIVWLIVFKVNKKTNKQKQLLNYMFWTIIVIKKKG